MTKSTSISGDMCNLEKTDGSQSDTAVSMVGTDDKKRRSSIGAKMQAMVGMSRKSRSTSQLSQTGRDCKCTASVVYVRPYVHLSCALSVRVLLFWVLNVVLILLLSSFPPTFILKGFGLTTDRLSLHTFFFLSFRLQLPWKFLHLSTSPVCFSLLLHSCRCVFMFTTDDLCSLGSN